MSEAPSWISDTVQVFGRQLGLKHFVLNEKGAAGVRFENGVRLAFEYAKSSLVISVRIPMPERADALCRLLAQAHYARGTVSLRAYYLKHASEGALAAALPDAQISADTIGAVFQNLWNAADYIRRNQEWR